MATVLKTQQGLKSSSRKTSNWSGMATGVYVLWLKQMRKFTSSSMEIVGTLSIPLLWMLLFGVCMNGAITGVTGSSIGYTAYITPGVMLLTSLTAAVLSGATLLNERLNGILKEYLVAPIPRLAVLLGTLVSGLTKAMLQAAVVLVLGVVLDGSLVLRLSSIVAGLVVIAIFSIGFVGVASAFASRAREMEGYHALIMILNLPVLFISNALYPLDKIPLLIKTLAFFNPTTYAVDAARHFFYGVSTEIGLWIDFPVLLTFMVIGVWFGFFCFKQSVMNPTD